MAMRTNVLVLGALCCIAAAVPAGAQTVYKCGSGGSVRYTELACSGRVVNTEEAPVPNPRAADARRIEQNRAAARAMRPVPGESAGQFDTRRRRARLLATDRDECARLDVRMPVEEASMKNPDPAEVLKVQAALEQSRKRFSDLRC
jgi:hypothetical protein